jgi:PhnB protein
MAVKPIPDGYTSVAPYLVVEDSRAAIDFYRRAFGATEHGLIPTPDGRVAHAEVKIGDTVVRLCDNLPIFEPQAPSVLGGTTVEIFLFVEDVDATVRRAADAGATVKAEPTNQFWGDRLARLIERPLLGDHLARRGPDSSGDRSASPGRLLGRSTRPGRLGKGSEGIQRQERVHPDQPAEGAQR